MMWQSSLPRVDTIAEWPPLVTDRKWCGCWAALIASAAICTLPSVPFLNPTGHDSPEASSRCTCDSVVRAPMAPQLTRSAMYCGVIMSRYSQPAGRPSSLISSSSSRASRSPWLIRKLPSRSGSLIRPFHPTVVRGFSKYTRITISSSPARRACSPARRRAYSRAAAGSWNEQGPITTTSRSSMPCRIRCTALRASCTVCEALSVQGNSRIRWDGGDSSLISLIRRSSVMYLTLWLRPLSMIASIGEKKPPGRWPGGFVSGCACRTCHPTPAARAFGNAKYQKNEKVDIVRQVPAVNAANLPNFRHAVQAGDPRSEPHAQPYVGRVGRSAAVEVFGIAREVGQPVAPEQLHASIQAVVDIQPQVQRAAARGPQSVGVQRDAPVVGQAPHARKVHLGQAAEAQRRCEARAKRGPELRQVRRQPDLKIQLPHRKPGVPIGRARLVQPDRVVEAQPARPHLVHPVQAAAPGRYGAQLEFLARIQAGLPLQACP